MERLLLSGKKAFARLRGRMENAGEGGWNGRKATAECAVGRTQRVLVDSLQDPSVVRHGIATQGTTVPTTRHPSLPITGIPMPMNIPVDEAFASLIHSMETAPSIQQRQSRARIQQAFRASTPETIEILMVGALGDLCTLLFAGNGALSDKIPVIWTPMPVGKLGFTSRREEFMPGEGGTLTIFMSTLLIPHAARDPALVWGTLVHELLHCHALIMSFGEEICRCGAEVGHGPGFYAAAVAAVRVLGIGEMGVGDVVDFEMGLCHADDDEMLLRRGDALEEAKMLCDLPQALQNEVVGWWEGIEVA